MKNAVLFSLTLAMLTCLNSATTSAQTAQPSASSDMPVGITTDIRDPVVLLRTIRQKREQAETPDDSLFRTSPLTPLRKWSIAQEKRIYEATDIKLGTTLTTLLQGLSDEIQGEDDFGMATGMSFVGTWDGWNKGLPKQGELTFEL